MKRTYFLLKPSHLSLKILKTSHVLYELFRSRSWEIWKKTEQHGNEEGIYESIDDGSWGAKEKADKKDWHWLDKLENSNCKIEWLSWKINGQTDIRNQEGPIVWKSRQKWRSVLERYKRSSRKCHQIMVRCSCLINSATRKRISRI